MAFGRRALLATILVVDDQIDACRALVRLLRHYGHDATCLGSGPDALTFLTQTLPDLLILDVMMPGMDGLDVLRVIRSDPRLQKLPVVLFSALSDPKFREYALNEGASDYWVKGALDFSRLDSQIAAHLPPA